MLAIVWPASWLLLLLIIPLEATTARRIMQLNVKQSLKLAGIANLVSTLLGIPVTWIGLVIVQFLLKGGGAYGLDTLLKVLYAVTVQSPWLIPYDKGWMVPAAALSLCVPFFLMSVWVEYHAAKAYLRGSVDKNLVLKWSWLANGLSYGGIVVLLLTMVLPGTLQYFGERINRTEIRGLVHPEAETVAPEMFLYGMPNGEVRVYNEELVKRVISDLSEIDGHEPQVDEVFKLLPDGQCVARATVKSRDGSIFRVTIPKQGKFVLAAETDGWRWDFRQENAKSYWLYAIQSKGESSLDVKLSEKNTVSANIPGQITLPVPDSTRRMELMLKLKLAHREACEEGKRAFHSQRFHDAEQCARQASALIEKLHQPGVQIGPDAVDSIDNLRAPILLTASLAEQGDNSQLDKWQDLLTKAYLVNANPCPNSYCADALAQIYLKENRREKAMSTYAQLLDNVQRAHYTVPTYDTPLALDHYASLFKQEKNVAEASKMQTLAVKFRQQLKEMSNHDNCWQSGMAPL